MASLTNIMIKKELRLCKVGKELGYFHCWEQYGDISNPSCQYSRVFGIVEFDERVSRIEPSKIKFIDGVHDYLHECSKIIMEKEET